MPPARKPARFIVLDTGQVIPLPAPPLIVGRRDPALGPDPDMALTDPTRRVGRRHARIEEKEGYTIQDLHSRNKTTFGATHKAVYGGERTENVAVYGKWLANTFSV